MNQQDFAWVEDTFDTKILEIPTAKIQSIEQTGNLNDQVLNLIKDLKGNAIEYATYRLNASSFALIHALERNGFAYVDGMLAMELTISEVVAKENSKIRPANENDIPALQELVKGLFKTRYYNDPVIDKNKVNTIFQKWVKNSVTHQVADEVLLYEEAGKILGFITIKRDGPIPLVGVLENAQGKGIGKLLIYAALNYFKQIGVKKAFIETQIGNVSAIRSYQSCGFKVIDSYLTFRWCDK